MRFGGALNSRHEKDNHPQIRDRPDQQRNSQPQRRESQDQDRSEQVDEAVQDTVKRSQNDFTQGNSRLHHAIGNPPRKVI